MSNQTSTRIPTEQQNKSLSILLSVNDDITLAKAPKYAQKKKSPITRSGNQGESCSDLLPGVYGGAGPKWAVAKGPRGTLSGIVCCKGWKVHRAYIDIASAGSLDRAEFTGMVRDAVAGKIDVVVAPEEGLPESIRDKLLRPSNLK